MERSVRTALWSDSRAERSIRRVRPASSVRGYVVASPQTMVDTGRVRVWLRRDDGVPAITVMMYEGVWEKIGAFSVRSPSRANG